MRTRRFIVIGAACLGTCGVAAAVYLFVLPLLFPPPDIGPRLPAIDSAIAAGYLTTARESLLALRPMPRREEDALRILKRAFLICSQTGDFGLLSVMSDRALSSSGTGPAVRLVAAYSYLRSGRLSDAERVANSGLPGGVGDLVRGEVILRKGGAWQGSDRVTRELLNLETSRRASDFAAAARDVQDKRLALDAALLWLQAGDLSNARSIAVSLLREERFDEIASLIDMDSGDFAAAIARLARMQSSQRPRADVALLLADCYHALGKARQLDSALHDAVEIDPRVSWTPYANLGLAAERRGDIPEARRVLEQGRILFPGARDLVMTTAQLEADQGNSAAAVVLLDGLVTDRPDDARAALLRLSLEAPGMSPQAYRAGLWKVFDRQPSQREVFMTLAAAMIASHDWAGTTEALRHYENAAGAQDADTLSIGALVQTMEGHEDLAIESMKQAAEAGGGGTYRYDLAVLLLHGGRIQQALGQLAQAQEEYRSSAGAATPRSGSNAMSGNEFRARVETLRGRCLMATGDVAGARAAFLRARALDPRLLRPGLELRKLEAQGVR
jgi:tetratricopeptide (TPR) repeat protein